MADLLQPDATFVVLDIATGAGHMALRVAPEVAAVVAADLAPEMLAQVEALTAERGITNITTSRQDVEHLDFDDDHFDAVICRIAPHHFTDIAAAMGQIARVIKPGGVFVLEDSCSPEEPELAEFINRVEALRDPTHVWSYPASRWSELCHTAGLVVEAVDRFPKRHRIEDWMERSATSPDVREQVRAAFRAAPAAVRERFDITFDERPDTDGDPSGPTPHGGVPVSYRDEKILLRARKPGAPTPPGPPGR
ncbi:MAG: class I SAM-dependent methyltransferase [Acidimicrobiales bacterium]